jgi:hypothetical protein
MAFITLLLIFSFTLLCGSTFYQQYIKKKNAVQQNSGGRRTGAVNGAIGRVNSPLSVIFRD